MQVAGLSPLQILAASAAIAAGSMVQGAVGFGAGVVAAPLLALVDPRLVPGPILVLGLVVSASIFVRERRAIDLFGLRWALLGRLVGAAVAAGVVRMLPERETTILFGAIVLLAVVLSVAGLSVRPTRQALIGAGALSGFMGTVSSIGGPPMALLYQRAPAQRLRATMSGYLAVGLVVSLTALAIAGEFGPRQITSSLLLVPGAVAGLLLSRPARSFLQRGRTRAAVLVLSAAASVLVILRQMV